MAAASPDRRLAAALGIALAALYAWLSCPSYGPGDSPQHALSALTLGVSRPPGYPLFGFLGKAWTSLAGPRSLGAFSGACQAAAVAALFLALRGQGCRPAAALLGSLLMAFGPLQWYYAQIPEVRALNHALALGSLLAALRWRQAGTARSCVALGALAGLGLGHHPTFVFVLPSLALAAWGRRPAQRDWGIFAAAAAAGLVLPYAALWLRLRAGAPLYNPDGVSGWRDVLGLWLREDTGGLLRVVPPGQAPSRGAGEYARWLGSALAREATWPGLGLAALGGWDLARRDPRRAGLWLAWMALGSAGYIIPASGQVALADASYQRAVAERFFTLPAVGAFALASFGAEALGRRVRPSLVWALAAAAAARAVLAPMDLRSHEPLRRYAVEALSETSDRDVIIPAGDDLAFALTYARGVDGVLGGRVILMPWLFGYGPYVDELRRRHPDLILPVKDSALDRDLAAWLRANPSRGFHLEGVQAALAGRLGGSPGAVLARVGRGATVDRRASARAFLASPLGRLTRHDLRLETQEVYLLENARWLAAWHARRLAGTDPDLESRLGLVLSGL